LIFRRVGRLGILSLIWSKPYFIVGHLIPRLRVWFGGASGR